MKLLVPIFFFISNILYSQDKKMFNGNSYSIFCKVYDSLQSRFTLDTMFLFDDSLLYSTALTTNLECNLQRVDFLDLAKNKNKLFNCIEFNLVEVSSEMVEVKFLIEYIKVTQKKSRKNNHYHTAKQIYFWGYCKLKYFAVEKRWQIIILNCSY